jgi:hypothetical protein
VEPSFRSTLIGAAAIAIAIGISAGVLARVVAGAVEHEADDCPSCSSSARRAQLREDLIRFSTEIRGDDGPELGASIPLN